MTLLLNYTIYLTNKNAFIKEKGRRTDLTSINMITLENVKTNTINVMTLITWLTFQLLTSLKLKLKELCHVPDWLDKQKGR